MRKRGKKTVSNMGKRRSSTLKDIALSETNTFGERMRAIDLMGELRDDAFDDLAEVASKGLTHSERMNALDMLENIVRQK